MEPKTPLWLHSLSLRREFQHIQMVNKTICKSDRFRTSGTIFWSGAPDPDLLRSQTKMRADMKHGQTYYSNV